MKRAAAATILLAAAAARADETTHLHAGGGAFLASTATPRRGGWLTAGVQAPGRWGGRLDVLDDGERGFWEGSVSYQLAASRPRLVVAFHAGAGWARGERDAPSLAAGVATQLGIVGPLAVGFDAAAHLTIEREPRVVLAAAAGLLLAF